MLQSIDIDRSLKCNRLVEKSGFHRVYDHVVLVLGLVSFVAFLGMSLSELPFFRVPSELSGGDFFFQSLNLLIVLVPLCVLLFFIIRRMIGMEKLTKVQGHNAGLNQTMAHTIIQEKNWPLYCNEADIVIARTSHGALTTRLITIIFNNNDLYVNVMTFGQGRIRSPFYFLKDQEILQSFIDDFRGNITKNT